MSALAVSFAANRAEAQACVAVSNNQTCTNPAGNAISNAPNGILDTATLTLNNFGSVTGTNSGVAANVANVLNSGSIMGVNLHGITVTSAANVINYGTIQAGSAGIDAQNVDINLTNYGTIVAGGLGLDTFSGSANIFNSGRITGAGGLFSNVVNLTNTGTIEGTGGGGVIGGFVNVTNSGTITGSDAIAAQSLVNLNNSGTVRGTSLGIFTFGDVKVVNSGTISGGGFGIYLFNDQRADVINSGVITGGDSGIYSPGIANAINSGVISGGTFGIQARTGEVTNSGTIIGGSGTAIRFFGVGLSDTLTVLPGARFGGLIDFGGGADRVNFGPGSWIINTANFNAGLSTITTAGSPYWVTPNQIVVADISSFGAVNRAMLDITGWIASVLPDTPVFDPVTNNAANAFAAIESASPRVNEAFSNFPSALPYAPTPVFKGGSVQDTAGNAFWAKGFGGRREQDTTGDFLGSVTTGYGGAIGYDRRFAGFQAGGFVGGSNNQTKLTLNAGSVDIDTTFGGGYVRAFFGASFLDVALIGGNLDTSSKRNIGGGLNLETASADYNGWYLNPIATLGHRIALGNGLTLTPAIKARYLKAHFDGYTETGSTANLTVNGRDTETFEERAELSLASVQYYGGDSRILFRMAGGALAQQRQGDGNVGLSFAGQSLLAVTADQPRVNGWYGNAGFDWQVGRLAVFAAGEITDTSDSAVTYSGRGGLRIVW